MRNPVKDARLKYTRGQAFVCGMFGLCEHHDVLSPRSPPALQGQMMMVLSDGKCPAEQQQERVSSDAAAAAVSRLSPAGSTFEFAQPAHDGRDGREGSHFAVTAAWQHQSGVQDDCCGLELRIATASEPSSAERLGVLPDSPLMAARALSPSDCAALEECPDGDRVPGFNSKRPADVQLLESFRREISGGRPLSRDTLAGLLQLAKGSGSWRNQLLAAGVVPPLLSVVAASGASKDSSGGDQGLEESFSLLALFAGSEDVRTQIAAEPSVLIAAGCFLSMGRPESKSDAACMLEKLSVVDGLKQAIGNCPLIMEGVVSLLRCSNSTTETAQDIGNRGSVQALVKSATKTLLALCLEKNNRLRAVGAGAVPALLEMLPDARAVSAERALATLELLATTAQGRVALTSHELGIPILVGMILKVSNRGTEYAAGALCAICSTGGTRLQEAAIQAGAPTQLLLLLQSDCTPRARRKAMQLLKLLHKLWEESPCNPDSFLIRSKAVVLL